MARSTSRASLSRQSSLALSDMSTDDVVPMDVASPRRAVSRSVSRSRMPSRAASPATQRTKRGGDGRPAVPFTNPEADILAALQRVAQETDEDDDPLSRPPTPVGRRRERRPSRSAPRDPSPVRRRPSAGVQGVATSSSTAPRPQRVKQALLAAARTTMGTKRLRRAFLVFGVTVGWFGLVSPRLGFGEPAHPLAPLVHATLCSAVSALF